MVFVSLTLAVMLEQWRPFPRNRVLHQWLENWMQWCEQVFFAGQRSHAMLTAFLCTGAPTLGVFIIYIILEWTTPWWVVVLFNILILYATMGFRQFSRYYSSAMQALLSGDLPAARSHAREQGARIDEAAEHEIVHVMMSHGIIQAHIHVLGVMTAYIALAALGMGPCGAVLYRLSEYWSRIKRDPVLHANSLLQRMANRLWHHVNWAPVRVTVMLFAAAGNFENTMRNWRAAAQTQLCNLKLLLTAATGALGLTQPLYIHAFEEEGGGGSTHLLKNHHETTLSVAHMQHAAALVWRAFLLGLVLVGLASLILLWSSILQYIHQNFS